MSDVIGKARAALPDILATVDDVPEAFRLVAFQELLRAELSGHGAHTSFNRDPEKQPEPEARFSPPSGSPAFATWALENQVDNGLDRLIDFDDGTILTTRLGRSTAEQTRTIGGLLAIHQAVQTGEFVVDKERHRQACISQGAYDSRNHAANMSKFSVNGRRIFLDKGASWQLTPDGKDWAGQMTKSLLGPVTE